MNYDADIAILGAGIYGLYAAKIMSEKGLRVSLIDVDARPFMRASTINQARIHNGYHYPRSYSTAVKSAHYFDRFNRDFAFALNSKFKKIYATSNRFSLVSGDQFETFCQNVKIPVDRINPNRYFIPNSVDAAFETEEYSFDAPKIRDWFMEKLSVLANVQLLWGRRVKRVENKGIKYEMVLDNDDTISAPMVLNATYASTNQVLDLFGFDLFKLKYEICEIIKCTVSPELTDVGITVMDGPFFSLMPFGLSGEHSLSAVTFTPHKTSHQNLPTFSCQTQNLSCTSKELQNCNLCLAKPTTAWTFMSQLSRKYLQPAIKMEYRESLFAIKPIPAASEIDDSRPTIIKSFSTSPSFMSVLSGKINTMYDLDQLLL